MSSKNLMIGLGIGAVLGVLFAPRKGSKTRKKLYQGGADFRAGIQSLLHPEQEEQHQVKKWEKDFEYTNGRFADTGLESPDAWKSDTAPSPL